MRLIIIVALIAVFVCGCSSRMDAHGKIREKFPNAEIAVLPSDNHAYGFVVRSSNEIWFVESYGEGYLKYTKILTAKPE